MKHFRSHPAIIRFSNERFYANELRPTGDPAITHSMLRSTVLDDLNPEFPIIFHGVGGRDQQEEGSPSYFNIEEASIVAKYCDELVSDKKVPICTSLLPIAPRSCMLRGNPPSLERYRGHQSLQRTVPQDSRAARSDEYPNGGSQGWNYGSISGAGQYS